MNNTRSIKDLLSQAKPPERSVPICLNAGITADIEAFERQLEQMGNQPDTGSLEGDPRTRVAQQIRALEDQAKEYTVDFRLRALPRHAYTALLKQHQPRDDDEGDRHLGYNRETFFAALIRASTVAPELDDADWLALLGDGTDEHPGVLSSRQFDALATGAWSANNRDVDVPFSRAASRILRISEPE